MRGAVRSAHDEAFKGTATASPHEEGTVDLLDPAAPIPTEIFERGEHGLIWRTVSANGLRGPRSCLQAGRSRETQDGLRAAWDRAWLSGGVPAPELAKSHRRRPLRVIDMFAGCGAMSLGVRMAADALGMQFRSLVAADLERAALDVYVTNLNPTLAFAKDVSKAIAYKLRTGRIETAAITAHELAEASAGVDVLIGGPPCQGHSDLNNHSRRDDPKNSLYLIMPAMALALQPLVVIIENVPAVVHDRSGVVAITVRTLAQAGYQVTLATVPMVGIGVPQRRRRHFLLAVRGPRVDAGRAIDAFLTEPRSVAWAISDLVDERSQTSAFDSASIQSARNRERIKWLFDHDEYDLPNSRRPTCHRDKVHSYVSMYGRMRWEEPAQTVTSGFGSPGQGRYIHAKAKRTLTPHEAARLQFFPDSFRFEVPGREIRRTELATMIGNAVPPKASYVLGLAAIASVARHPDS